MRDSVNNGQSSVNVSYSPPSPQMLHPKRLHGRGSWCGHFVGVSHA